MGKPNSEVAALPPEPVTGRYFLTWFDHGETMFGSYRVWTFIRVFESQGNVGICGAYVADLPPARADLLTAAFEAEGSYVDMNGIDFSRPGLRINPGFMRFARRAGDDHFAMMRDTQAGCVRTARTWDPSFEKPKLAMNIRLNVTPRQEMEAQ
jgi:hypothetical protein